MSYANFKRTIWSKHIQRALEQSCILWDGCNHEFEGEAKKGARVKILGVGRPTIGTYTGADIGAPEAVADSSVFLDIDQAKYFNFAVDDVDKAQSVEGLMAALMQESAAALSETRDKYIGQVAAQGGTNCGSQQTITTDSGAKAAVDAAVEALWTAGVKVNDPFEIVLAPWLYMLFRNSMTTLSTDNPELLKKGIVGYYAGGEVRLSNCLYKSSGYDCNIVRTKKAVAAAGQIDETEAYRPEGTFADAVKGLDVYGAKVVRPKECQIIRAKNA